MIRRTAGLGEAVGEVKEDIDEEPVNRSFFEGVERLEKVVPPRDMS